MTYQDQLLDPRWKEKRLVIIDRDRMCFDCGSTRNLNVHHIWYKEGLKAWEYPDSALVTLCADCHGLRHGLLYGKPIPSVPHISQIMGTKMPRKILDEKTQYPKIMREKLEHIARSAKRILRYGW